MSTDADDGSNDGRWQREAAQALTRVLDDTAFVGGILLAVTPAGRVVPVIGFPGEIDLDDVAQMLRYALDSVEARRVSREPKR